MTASASRFMPLCSDSSTTFRLNVHSAIIDEFHSRKTRAAVDVLDTVTGATWRCRRSCARALGGAAAGPARQRQRGGMRSDRKIGGCQDHLFFARTRRNSSSSAKRSLSRSRYQARGRTAQESAYALAVQRAETHGPPMYYTVEWDKGGKSVTRLADLEPEIVITGHGVPMRGTEMRAALHRFA